MRTLFAAAAFAVAGAVAAQAADIAAMTGHMTKLGADCSALVLLHRRARRLPRGGNDPAGPDRPGGGRAVRNGVGGGGSRPPVSIPRTAGEASARIVLSNAGDHLHIAKPSSAVSAR